MSRAKIRKHCPFCGRVDMQEVSHSPRWGYFVRCVCHAVGPSAGSYQGAIDAWNTRKEPDQRMGEPTCRLFAKPVVDGMCPSSGRLEWN